MLSKICIFFTFFVSFLFANEPLKIVYNAGTPPLKFTNNNLPSGMLIDIWKLWAKKSGVAVEFIEAPWDDTISMIRSNSADIHAGIYYTKQRDIFLDYTSKPLYDNNRYFFYHKSIGKIENKNQLKPYVIGIDNGYAVNFMKENYKNFAIKEYKNSHEADNAFFKGETKVVLASLPTFFYDLKINGYDEKNFSYSNGTYAYSKQYFGAVKDGNIELLKQIDEGFKKISEEELKSIELKWTKDLDLTSLNANINHKLITKNEKDYLNKKRKIIMCVDPKWLPFEAIEKKKHIGMVADIFKLFQKKLAIPIELKVTNTWAKTLEYAKTRECDIISAAAKTTNRQNYLSFTIPYLKFPQVIVTREKEPFIDDFRKVINRRIGVVKDSAIEELLKEKYPTINLVEVKDVLEGLFKVSSGELYGFINTTAAVSYSIAKNGMTNIKIASKTGIDYYLSTAIRSDDPYLLDIFNKIISKTDKNEIEKIKDTWLTVKVDEVIDYTLFYQLLGWFILIVLFVLYWNRKLHIEIDERKAAQEQLNKFLQVIEQSQISVMITDKKGTIEYVNPYTLKETGYFIDELVGSNPRILNSGKKDEAFYKNMWDTILSGKTWVGEFLNKKKNGEFFWESAIIAPIFDKSKRIKYFASIKEDITKDKQVQKELQVAQKEAEMANRAKSDFLAKMSHEIRTPMNAILGMLYLLEKTTLNSIQDSYIKKANGAANSLLGVINDILDFSKIEANKLEIKNEEFNIHQVINDIMSVMSVKAEENQLELLTYYDKNFPIHVISDKLRFSQVLNNLLSNAIKFTKRGEILLSTKQINKKNGQANLMFCVKDSGIGISKENQDKLFQEFTQVDDSATRSFHGTGLGLAICKKLSTLLDGDIWLEDSQEGVGTTFCFSLKVGLSSKFQDEKLQFPKTITHLKVLVVDDNHLAAKVLADMLKSFEYSVDVTYSGKEAISLIEKNNYDLVFLDYKMPKLNGVETFKLYKEKLKDKTPTTIFITAFSQELIEEDIEQLGASAYLTKPMSPSTLYDTIMESLHSASISLRLEKNGEKELEKLDGQKVLLVEDNILNQEFAIAMLESFNLNVDTANDGFEAIEKIKKTKYALVLMDIQMPKLDGLEATKKIRAFDDEYFKNVPIIALSANALVGDKEKSLNAGMNDHIPKPIKPDKLFITLKKYIDEVVLPSEVKHKNEFKYIQKLDKNILNIDEAMARMANNEKSYIKILEQFYGNYKNVFDLIDEFIANNDLDKLNKKIHELKGISGNIAAKELFKDLEEINTLLSSSQMPPFESFAKCKKNLNRVLEQISNLDKKLDENIKEVSKEFDKELVSKKLYEIKNYLDIDIVKCEEILENLTPYLQDNYADVLSDISNALYEFNTDKVDELIDKFLRTLNND